MIADSHIKYYKNYKGCKNIYCKKNTNQNPISFKVAMRATVSIAIAAKAAP